MKKILTVVGARPQFIKTAVVSRALQKVASLKEIIVHTGQHYDPSMSEIFFEEMDIPQPGYNLEIGSGGHGLQTGRMMEKLEEVFLKEKPALCLVYGDTNSTLAGALVASKLHVPVAHVEAGLRSFNRKMAEEINRILTDQVSEILFCPTPLAVQNLENEGLSNRQVLNVGDVMLDASLFYAEKSPGCLKSLSLKPKEYVLMTLHRAENTDHPHRLKAIFEAVKKFSLKHPVILPLHPRTKKFLQDSKLLENAHSIRILDPVGYSDMLALAKNACLIATDSGGLQKESFFFKVPCVTLRSETEWVELIESGWACLADPEQGADFIFAALEKQLGRVGNKISPYGDGSAGTKIVSTLKEFLKA